MQRIKQPPTQGPTCPCPASQVQGTFCRVPELPSLEHSPLWIPAWGSLATWAPTNPQFCLQAPGDHCTGSGFLLPMPQAGSCPRQEAGVSVLAHLFSSSRGGLCCTACFPAPENCYFIDFVQSFNFF